VYLRGGVLSSQVEERHRAATAALATDIPHTLVDSNASLLGEPLLPVSHASRSAAEQEEEDLRLSDAVLRSSQRLRRAARHKPKARRYRSWRQSCCDCCLGLIVVATIGTFVVVYAVEVASDQGYYDPCYTQVHIEALKHEKKMSNEIRTGCNRVPYRGDDGKLPPEKDLSLRNYLEHRADLMNHIGPDKTGVDKWQPQCICCNQASAPTWNLPFPNETSGYGACTLPSKDKGPNKPFNCSQAVGTCCGRSTGELPLRRRGHPLPATVSGACIHGASIRWRVGVHLGRPRAVTEPDEYLREKCSVPCLDRIYQTTA
jgi:hypothetical protein